MGGGGRWWGEPAAFVSPGPRDPGVEGGSCWLLGNGLQVSSSEEGRAAGPSLEVVPVVGRASERRWLQQQLASVGSHVAGQVGTATVRDVNGWRHSLLHCQYAPAAASGRLRTFFIIFPPLSLPLSFQRIRPDASSLAAILFCVTVRPPLCPFRTLPLASPSYNPHPAAFTSRGFPCFLPVIPYFLSVDPQFLPRCPGTLPACRFPSGANAGIHSPSNTSFLDPFEALPSHSKKKNKFYFRFCSSSAFSRLDPPNSHLLLSSDLAFNPDDEASPSKPLHLTSLFTPYQPPHLHFLRPSSHS
ncbi:hypothetical protein BDY21DRAFT_321649 [Lineolata rhizophorae]|uniref:Uncharacterized protein n=1 Tax=Lineolata rhizophorae TaxID=578093 RepID=A0A6A6P0I2_9PEZI|nr:hypothetical protein BDY21DRAFT_321649 [Lineolata rhizophorae]